MRDFFGEVVAAVACMSEVGTEEIKQKLHHLLDFVDDCDWLVLQPDSVHVSIAVVLSNRGYLTTCSREQARLSIGSHHYKLTDTGVWLAHMSAEGLYHR